MSPFVRGRIIPETESTGRTKRALDVLLWLPQLSQNELASLDLLELLRIYLRTFSPPVCSINLWIPSSFAEAGRVLSAFGVAYQVVVETNADKGLAESLKELPDELLHVAATAMSVDADTIVINNRDWLPFVPDLEKVNTLLADCHILLRQAELFVRGHDLPWAFDYMVWNEPWSAFYPLSEGRTFRDGMAFLEVCQKKANPETNELARMLIYNRLPNLCYTRDRLLFYEVQQSAAKRARWKRQEFLLEAAYYLNFYYILIHGGFDHLACVVNGALSLGLPPRAVGAGYEAFLKALAAKSPTIHSHFTSPEVTEFQDRIAALRHFAAHRGSIMPGIIYEAPVSEPTIADLDVQIRKQGLDEVLRFIPPGPLHDAVRENLRFQTRLSMYKKVAEGVVELEIKGKKYFIQPMNDIEWNFIKFHKILVQVLNSTKDVM